MSAVAEGRGLIHKGDKTTTGGVVTSGVGNVMFVGEGVTQTGMIATCPSCKKGQGKIAPLKPIPVIVDGVQAALHGDIVACGCPYGSNTLIASPSAMSFSKGSDGNIHGFKPHASNLDMEASYQAMADSVGGRYAGNPPFNAAQQSYAFTEKEWNEDLKSDLREYLEGRHTQVCIFTVDDAARCALNIWNQKKEDGETIGSDVLGLLDEIHSKIDMGVGLIAATKVSKALGGLGVTVKQYFDAKGIERVIVSSFWNDTKMHYATVNGLNIKKNHPYRISNPTIKQLGVLAEDTVNGFKKGAVLSLIISATINTNELVFNDDYHLVDWCGSMGSDLFKAMSVLALSSLAVALTVAMGISMPIIAGVLVWVGIELFVDSMWDEFKVEDSIVNGLKDATA